MTRRGLPAARPHNADPPVPPPRRLRRRTRGFRWPSRPLRPRRRPVVAAAVAGSLIALSLPFVLALFYSGLRRLRTSGSVPSAHTDREPERPG